MRTTTSITQYYSTDLFYTPRFKLWSTPESKTMKYFDQWSVGQSVLASGTYLGLATIFSFLFLIIFRQLRVWCGASSLTRGRVCSLQLLLGLSSAFFLGSGSRWTHDHILLPQFLDYPNLESQVPVFISPRNKVSQLYPQALGYIKIKFLSRRKRIAFLLQRSSIRNRFF
jgi:hypothetical protein